MKVKEWHCFLYGAFAVGLVGVQVVMARPNVERPGPSGKSQVSQNIRESHARRWLRAAPCEAPSSQIDLDVNNVRARLQAGGDKWWDLVSNAQYEVPKGSGCHSMFAGAVWIGGFDPGGTLRLAAQTYRQTGVDFWTGPIRPDGTVDREHCLAWDRHWKVTRTDIDILIRDYAADQVVNGPVPTSLKEWPAVGNPFISIDDQFIGRSVGLAPFVDVDGDNLYNPANGDYPDVPGDMAIWWVYNDVGDVHTETQAEAIGVEIQALAFAFATNDEINDMTFYDYTIIYHGTVPLDSTYIAMWVDPDLGCYRNDFVGCDTSLDLGIVYNGEQTDPTCDGVKGYSDCTPGAMPIAGTDFFQGPWSPEDSMYLGMSAFIYYNNDFTVIGNPETGIHFYNYMTCTWKDGTPVTEGGNGYGGNVPTCFMFTGDPADPTGWSECTEGNTPFDRRYLMSSGPFRLDPGAVNKVTIATIWTLVQDWQACSSFDPIRDVDQKAQALYDLGFQLLEGPEAPNITIRELDQELILTLWNPPGSNNENEDFKIVDRLNLPQIKALGSADSFYRFEGYLIYQLRDATVSPAELNDPTRARLIAQVDLDNGVTRLINWTFDRELNAWIPQVMVEGADEGIRHTFRITTDAFSDVPGAPLINYQPYYFMVVAYAYNNFLDFDPARPLYDTVAPYPGQPIQFLAGRKNVRVYVGIPHKPGSDAMGTVLNASYGQGPRVYLLEGMAGARHRLVPAPESEDALALGQAPSPAFAYLGPASPIEVKVIDPLQIRDASYRLFVTPHAGALFNVDPAQTLSPGDTLWYIVNVQTGEIIFADIVRFDTLGVDSVGDPVVEQVAKMLYMREYAFPEYGFSVRFRQYPHIVDQFQMGTGLVEMSLQFQEAVFAFLDGITDQDGDMIVPVGGGGAVLTDALNWILSGTEDGKDIKVGTLFLDPAEIFEKEGLGWWAPYMLVRYEDDGLPRVIPGLMGNQPGMYLTTPSRVRSYYLQTYRRWFSNLRSVEIVITPDPARWTRAPVVETGRDPSNTEGGAQFFELRKHPSLNLDGTYSAVDSGWGWFPGYVIDLESGKRLAIIYGENSLWPGAGGRDMLWNPGSATLTSAGLMAGGHHYVYILNIPYSQRGIVYNILQQRSPGWDTLLVQWIMWVGVPVGRNIEQWRSVREGLVPTEARIRLILSSPFRASDVQRYNQGYPVYEFSFEGMAPQTGVVEKVREMLDSIRVVPNPYYGFSAYEVSRLDNHVKITNLPPGAKIHIYSIDGTLIRILEYQQEGTSTLGDDNLTGSVVWDLKNHAGIPISSGLYLIHVQVEGVGETIVKFLAIMRPVDLNNF